MSASGQKFVARNRAPRVQIEYDVELYGVQKTVQLPFVMGVMSDLAGKSAEPQPSVADRRFLEIDVDNFDDRMKAMKPRAAFAVPNTLTGEGSLPVDLTFERIEDFSPAAVAGKIEPLAKLLGARTQLAHLMTYMDGKAGAEDLIARLIADPEALGALAGAAPEASGEASPGPALDALRAAAPAAAETPDASAAAFAALRAAPRAAAETMDATASALDGLRAAGTVPAPAEPDAAAAAFAALRDAPRAAPEASEDAGQALAALRQAGAAAATERADAAGEALEALRQAAPAAPAPVDPAGSALDALRAAAPSMPAPATAGEAAAIALAGLRGSAPVLVESPSGDLADGGGAGDAAESPAPHIPSPATPAVEDGPPQAPFGRLARPRPEGVERPRFRIALLGDFSGRAARGLHETGPALAARKPIRLDIDDLDRVIARFAATLVLPLGADGAGVEVPLGGLDDLHPDALHDNVALFEALAGLRARVARGEASALAEVQGWGGEAPAPAPTLRGGQAPAGESLSDFRALIGAPAAPRAPSPAEELIRRIVGPHVQAAPDPRQESLTAAVDAALSTAMRAVLHHPEFQALEAAWRSLELLARRVGGGRVEIALYDVSAAEWAADLAAQEELGESGLFGMLAEAPRLDAGQGAFSAVFGLYELAETPAHAALMARMARIAAWMDAPFVAAVAPETIDTPLKDRAPAAAKAWDDLRALPAAGYVGLATPGFVLRLPYGRKTEPVEPFAFEEFESREGTRGMLWANPALTAAILMAETAERMGPAKMRLGEIMSLDDMPLHHAVDAHGDLEALPCTERLLDGAGAAKAVERGLIPLLSIKGRNVVRQGSFQALTGRDLAGPWASAPASVVDAEPGGAPVAAPAAQDAEPPAEAEGEAALSALDDLLGAMEDAPAAPAGDDDGMAELDALMASLSEETSAGDAPADDGTAELDALMASLSEETPAGDASADDGTAELDALMASLSDEAPAADAPADDGTVELDAPMASLSEAAQEDEGDSDLDALLAALEGDAPPSDASGAGGPGDEMDPDLAALLKDL
ncbi:MAG: type VI secretion system contractile sheath small subunit [Albimonas sp.]|uniref:type VI secretion system contractile sheath small subunit n=1 Tax=Albimonas sp. TaxID=1872425 RepID=UPI004056C6D6